MALRLKVNRLSLIKATQEAIASVEQSIEKVEQAEEAWDWRIGMRKAMEELTALSERDGLTEKEWDDGLYSVYYEKRRVKPDFTRQAIGLKGQRKHLLDLLDLLKLNKDDEVSVSTSDEHIIGVIRQVRRQKEGRA